MESTNSSIATSSLPQNLSLSGLESSIFLVNGEKIQIESLDFSDEQMNILAADTKARGRIVLREIFVLGHNLLLAKKKFVEDFGDDKEFLRQMSEKTDTPIAELKKRISVAENYSIADIELLMEKGVSVTAAVKLSKLPAAREELLEVAKETQGKKVSPAIISEISRSADFSTGEEDQEKQNEQSNEELPLFARDGSTENENRATARQVVPEKDKSLEASIKVEKTTEEEVTTTVYHSGNVENLENWVLASELQEAKTTINLVLDMAHRIQIKSEISARAGQNYRLAAAMVFAAVYDIPFLPEKFVEGEEPWITDLRLKITETGTANICAMYAIGFVEGWVSFIQDGKWNNFLEGNPDKPGKKLIPPPLDYDSLIKGETLVASGIKKMKEFYQIGYQMAKERNQAW